MDAGFFVGAGCSGGDGAGTDGASPCPRDIVLPGGSSWIRDGSGGRETHERLFGRRVEAPASGAGGACECEGESKEEDGVVDVFGFLAEAEHACGLGDREDVDVAVGCA